MHPPHHEHHAHHHHGPGPIGFEGLDPASSEVFEVFRRVMHLNRQYLGRAMATADVHPGAQGVLRILAAHEGMSQRDLAECLHLSRPTVTTMLQRMEQQGFIERWDDEADQRLTRLKLTPSGRTQADASKELFAHYVDETVGSLSEPDRAELARLLTALADNTAAALKRLDDAAPEKNA